MSKYSETQNKWTQEYIQKAYDTITVRVPKGKREEYKKCAEKKGTSLNKLILDYLESLIN